jgi:hypothetical protein
MLQDLTQSQVESALQYLHLQPTSFPPPSDLKELNPMEWFLLDRMLDCLLKEKESSQLQ